MSDPDADPHGELVQLARHLLDRERQTSRRLAHSLHDDLGQTLAALRLHWDACRGAPLDMREGMDARIANLIVLANRQLRVLLAELSPPLLDDLGLAAALDNEIRQHAGDGCELRVVLDASPEAQLQRWPADVEHTAFMIARDALLEALRRPGARELHISLAGDDGLLALTLADVDAPDAGALPEPDRLGRVAMRERALAVGASLRVDEHPGHGTITAVTWMP